jgi:hypothetical protein
MIERGFTDRAKRDRMARGGAKTETFFGSFLKLLHKKNVAMPSETWRKLALFALFFQIRSRNYS